ncbi:hypothetical protein CEE45_05695 [Candidatus Heimdallarchaeota archaeon B3_Heim]|nr:MAG: hypothetical protein CEE45_05695 [Candidatus Heimdallarchaeota archaeon B3_Heim]
MHKRYRQYQKKKISVLTTQKDSLHRVYGSVRPMIRKIIRPSIIVFVIMLSLGILPSTQPKMIQLHIAKAQSISPLLEIQQVNLEVEKNGKYQLLEELVLDEPTTGKETLIPQLVNNSKLRVNASYSTIIGNPESIVIHIFAVKVYEVLTGQSANLTWDSHMGQSRYSEDNPEELILPPNSSKSEVIIIPYLALPTYGNYKFVFTVQYHVYGGETVATEVYFAKNMSFEFVESLPEPPYILYFLFYSVLLVLIAFVTLGVYGTRKYKDLEI